MAPNLAKPEIQEQPSGQGTGRPLDESEEKRKQDIEEKKKQEEKRKQAIEDQIFNAAMENKWPKVLQLYIDHNFLHESKLTRSEDTALHLAISSYHPDRGAFLNNQHFTCVKGMITNISEEKRLRILQQKNQEGNTPLHLAAELGSDRIIECLVNSKNHTLISETNSNGETPLFITAYHGKLQAFLYLRECVQDESLEDQIKLFRRKDGDNILHAAISGAYFKLAFQIIKYYPTLVNRYNTQGMSPLYLLSRMPQVFKSGSHFRFIDSIIYYGINIKEIEPTKNKEAERTRVSDRIHLNLPENYQTLVDFLERLRNVTRKICDTTGATNENQEKKSPAAQATNVNPEKKSPGHQSCRQNDPENPPIKDATGATNENQEKKSPGHQNDPKIPPTKDATGEPNENQEKNKSPGHQNDPKITPTKAEGKRNGKLCPANYTIFIEFLKCLMKILLLVLGIGLQRIKKLEERKRKHTFAFQIMKLLIENEERYKSYKNTGEEPEKRDHDSQGLAPPPKPPLTVEDENKKEEGPSNTARTERSPTSSTDKKKIDDHNSELFKPTKETPLLVASKMGIVEMVKRILKKFPIAIQDTDSDEKNILLLAVEHRQTEVYNWLVGEKYPERVFYQVDKKGNNAVHLAAMYQKLEVWRIPGTALQLQGERKWYKYVKQTLPPVSYVRYNKKGQTPRQVFIETHAKLLKDGTKWLITTAESFSFVAALIATVAFATSSQFPGGPDNDGHPHLQNQFSFDVFSMSTLVSLCCSVTALVFFLAILTSRCQLSDFEKDLPTKLFLGLTSLFASITGILISFCAAHFFILSDNFKPTAFPIYAATCIPVVFFALNQFPLYVDLIRSYMQKRPLRSYKVFYTDPSVADQKKEDKEKED